MTPSKISREAFYDGFGALEVCFSIAEESFIRAFFSCQDTSYAKKKGEPEAPPRYREQIG